MTDRELLELAAKAAGIDITSEHGRPQRIEIFRGHLLNYEDWNPITDDGDALRLAVKLDFAVCIEVPLDNVRIDGPSPHGLELVNEKLGYNPYAATRRAIVRAAAEIGKGMK